MRAELATAAAAGDGDEASFVKNATLLLCRLSKLLQIDCYFTVNVDSTVEKAIILDIAGDKATSDSNIGDVSTLKGLYADMYGLLAGKGNKSNILTRFGGSLSTASADSTYLADSPILPLLCSALLCRVTAALLCSGIGGLREVQPGDELLMLCSAEHWQRVQAQACLHTQTQTPGTQSDTDTHLCLEWAETVLVGREASPHNYCFSVAAMEPLRRLGCTQDALDGEA